MKTAALLMWILAIWLLCTINTILYLDLFLNMEKKRKGLILVGLKEKSAPLIVAIIITIVEIIGIIWTIVTFSSIYGNIGGIISSITTVVIISVTLYIMRKIKRS